MVEVVRAGLAGSAATAGFSGANRLAPARGGQHISFRCKVYGSLRSNAGSWQQVCSQPRKPEQ